MRPRSLTKILLLTLFVLAALFYAVKTIRDNHKPIPDQTAAAKAEEDKEALTAQSWYRMKRFHDAEMAYVSAVVRHPDSLALWYNLGNTFFKQGKYQEAVNAYQKAATINLNDPDVQFNLKLARQMLAPGNKNLNGKPADKDSVKDLKPKQRKFLENLCDIFRQ